MKKIIRASAIDDEKKRDFEDIVAVMNRMLMKRADGLAPEEVGRMYLLIAGCEGLLMSSMIRIFIPAGSWRQSTRRIRTGLPPKE